MATFGFSKEIFLKEALKGQFPRIIQGIWKAGIRKEPKFGNSRPRKRP